MARTFTKSPKPRSKMVDSGRKNGQGDVKFDKQPSKKKLYSKTPVKIPSLETAKKNKFSDNKQKNDKRVASDTNSRGKEGFFNKQSRGEKKQNSMNPEKMEFVKNDKREETRVPIKVSAFEKMKMKKVEVDVAGLLTKRKRTKRMSMKINRYHVSNKRFDDGIVLDDISNQQKKKKKDEEGKEKPENEELSVNAQFRAIKPSPSILTFVQENFLGRRRDIELQRAGYNVELSAPLDNLPFTTSSERERVEENVFRNKLEFFAAAKVSSSFPPPDLPEIAFAGRSNVGKSSLLNALTRQWGVVRTSDKPGHTQSINFFNLGSKLNLVDLPGYGFAYAKDEVKEAWEELVKEYLSTRVGLKRVCLLIDTKWGMKPRDIELIHLMERSQTKYQVVLTKTDVVFPIDVARRAMQIEETLKEHKSIVQPVMMVSSKSGAGIRCLRTVLGKMARYLKP
ncbi:uncharacterized protein LOC141628157 isoform X1 [Silene latifolia]|uniref:uncharacterized protein LOC141628157 isoform X1 n=1 Tax=Silene latifolia TaxID=37657 RepID=UPI003D76DABA